VNGSARHSSLLLHRVKNGCKIFTARGTAFTKSKF
jgi:hypothetical protein